jgi:hypothetical protein
MHVQAKVIIDTSGFADDDEENDTAISATYGPGALLRVLEILAQEGFNLRVATGRRIELGGEFGFAVDPRERDTSHEQATQAAVDALKSAGFDAHVVEVQVRFLDHKLGALRAFVKNVSDQGLLIEEIAVATPNADGRIPVQIFTVRAGGGQAQT